jgi:hypothetical protein
MTGTTKECIANVARWILFLPVSIAGGVLGCMAINLVGGKAIGGEDGEIGGPIIIGLIAGISAGWMTIEMAVAIAPGFVRAVTWITFLTCVSLFVAWIWWAHARNGDINMRLNAWFTGTLYVISSGMTAYLYISGRRRKGDFKWPEN